MAVKLKIRKGDPVEVLVGKDKGKRGDVVGVLKGKRPGNHRVFVRGANMVKRHTQPSPENPGGIVEKEASIHISNVALIDPKDDKPGRAGWRTLEDGRKVRFIRQSGEIIDR